MMLRSLPCASIGPSFDCGETVLRGVAHRILDNGVVPDADAGVAPPIEALTDVVAIAEANVLFENGRAGTQDELDAPFHAVDSIDVAYGDAALPSSCVAYEKSTGDIDIQLCETGKLNSTPNAAHAPR